MVWQSMDYLVMDFTIQLFLARQTYANCMADEGRKQFQRKIIAGLEEKGIMNHIFARYFYHLTQGNPPAYEESECLAPVFKVEDTPAHHIAQLIVEKFLRKHESVLPMTYECYETETKGKKIEYSDNKAIKDLNLPRGKVCSELMKRKTSKKAKAAKSAKKSKKAK